MAFVWSASASQSQLQSDRSPTLLLHWRWDFWDFALLICPAMPIKDLDKILLLPQIRGLKFCNSVALCSMMALLLEASSECQNCQQCASLTTPCWRSVTVFGKAWMNLDVENLEALMAYGVSRLLLQGLPPLELSRVQTMHRGSMLARLTAD